MKNDTQLPLPENIASVLESYPDPARAMVLHIRAMIQHEASALNVGPLRETLKWGEPAWLTEVSKAGSTIRLAWKKNLPHSLHFLVNCKTDMITTWREQFPQLDYAGNRAIHLPLDAPLPEDALRLCIARALTYHRVSRS